MAGRDATECLWLFFRNSPKAEALRAMLVAGIESVFESGEVTPDTLNALVQTRRDAGVTDKALCVIVQDAGEDRTRVAEVTLQHVFVRVYDRGRGYRNLRVVRDELKRVLAEFSNNLVGMLSLEYIGRTGHRWDRYYAIEYEALEYSARVAVEEVSM